MLDVLQTNGLYLLIGEYPAGPIGGLALTLMIAGLTLVLVFPTSILVALARTSGLRFLSWPAAVYVNAIRSVPILLIIFWVYLFAPAILGFTLSGFTTLVVAIVAYQTAYLSEVIRAGILALPKGQLESARSLGLSYIPIMLRIVLPQVLFNVSPGILVVLTNIVKESSLGYLVGVSELTLTASHVNSLTLTKPLQVFAITALMYFAICYSLSLLARSLERRGGRHFTVSD